MTKMTYLRLHTTRVTDAGLEHLKGMANLERLDLWETEVTDAGVARLKRTLPRLSVIMRR